MKLLRRIIRKARSVARRVRARVVPPPPRLPFTATTINLGAREVALDPYPHYEELRRAGSVQFLRQHNAWIVLGYDDVQSALTHPNIFSNRPYAEVDSVLLSADPPKHPAVRRIVSRYFSAEVLERLGAFAEEHAATLLKPQMDAVRDYSIALSEAVAAQLIGFDHDDVETIHAAYAAAPELGPFTTALDCIADVTTMYERLTADGLEDHEARSLVRLFWLAATTTTARVIARCVLSLLQHGDVRATLEGDSALIPSFVEEVLRLHPPELLLPRITTEPVTLGGSAIPAGEVVHLCVAAANRDPLKFENPAELRLDRATTRHFSFGFGIHHCVGATLGRRTIEIAVRTLLTRAPRFRAVQPLQDVVNWCSMTANPVERLLIEHL